MSWKRFIAGAALRQIAHDIETAPPTPNLTRGYTADQLLDAVVDGDYVDIVPDPTSADGVVDYCKFCQGEPHDSHCPVGVLEELAKIGLEGAVMLPVNIGLAPRQHKLVPQYEAGEDASESLREYQRAFKARENSGLGGDQYLAHYWEWQFRCCQEILGRRIKVMQMQIAAHAERLVNGGQKCE